MLCHSRSGQNNNNNKGKTYSFVSLEKFVLLVATKAEEEARYFAFIELSFKTITTTLLPLFTVLIRDIIIDK